MMSLMGSVSRGLRAGWGQLRVSGLMSRASVRGVCWYTHDSGMDQNDSRMEWNRRRHMFGNFHCMDRGMEHAAMDFPGMPFSNVEPPTMPIFGGLSRASYMSKFRVARGTGTGCNNSSADGVGSSKPTAEALSSEAIRVLNRIAVTMKMENSVVYYGDLLFDMIMAFDVLVSRLGYWSSEAPKKIDPEELNGVLVLGSDLLSIYEALECAASQLSKREPEYRTAKDVSTCMEVFEQQVDELFTKHRVTMIPALGLPLNKYEHSIKEYVITNTVPPGTVLEVEREGYKLFGEVMRESLVVVSMEDNESTRELTWLRRI